ELKLKTTQDAYASKTKKKSLALKGSSHEEDSDENNDEEEDDDEESEDQIEGFEFLLREFNKFAQRKIKSLKNKSKPPKCYECGELEHINQIATRFKRRRNKKRRIRHIFHGKTKTIPLPPPMKTKTPTFVI
ncbi:hypothetical protein PIB30_067166, partial [Stylosanthes scabra]|nr:hypothetical protein [Stylosanthes scabra]